MSYLHAVGLILLLVLSVASWFIAVAGAMVWCKGKNTWPWFDRIVWWSVFAVAVASTAWLMVL